MSYEDSYASLNIGTLEGKQRLIILQLFIQKYTTMNHD